MSRAPTPPLRGGPFLPPDMRDDLNNMRRQLNDLSRISGNGDGILVQRGPFGTTVVDSSPDLQEVAWYGVLVDKGPNGEADFADARYWVRSVALCQTQGASIVDTVAAYMDASFLDSAGSPVGGQWIVANNLREMQTGGHAMPVIASTTSLDAVLPAGACIVRVIQAAASKFTNIQNDYGNLLFFFEPVSANGNGGTSSGSSTLVLGGTSALLYTNQRTINASDGDTLITSAFGSDFFNSMLNPIPYVDNGSGGTYFPWVAGNVFRVRGGGSGHTDISNNTDGSNGFSISIFADADEICIFKFPCVPNANDTVFEFGFDVEITVAASGTSGSFGIARVMGLANLSGDSLTITGAFGGLPWSYAAANVAGDGGFPRGVTVMTNTPATLKVKVNTNAASTLTLTSFTAELLGPPINTTP